MNHDVNVKVDTSALDSKFQQVKKHFCENKKTYLAGAGGLAMGALFAKNAAAIQQTIDSWKLIHIQYKSPNMVINALGDPGNIIQCVETGTVYASQNQAARELGVAAARISEHLHGKLPHVNGQHFEIIAKAIPEPLAK
jgi:hypothetical protein